MDPEVMLAAALTGAAASRIAYNEWVAKGGREVIIGTQVHTDAWMCGIRNVSVKKIGTKYVEGSHPVTKTRLRLPISVLEER